MNFFYILNTPEHFIIYTHAKKVANLIFAVNQFLKIRKTNRKLSLIYSSEEESSHIDFHHQDVVFYKSPINYEQGLLKHNMLKDRNVSKTAYREEFIKLYDMVALTAEQVEEELIKRNKPINSNVRRGIQISKNDCFKEYSIADVNEEDLLSSFVDFVCSNITNEFDFKSFLSLYSFPCMTSSWFGDRASYKTVVLEDVYYKNKGFYCKDGTFFDIKDISQDVEYKHYNKINVGITPTEAVTVLEPVLFLDYIYDFYNFGEFWDVLKRLVYFKREEPVEIYGLKENRILDISKYFLKCGLTYPPKYCRDYKFEDTLKCDGKGSTLFFKKAYFSTINGTARSEIDPWSAFEINRIFNKSTLEKDTKFNLYLSRGKMSRGILHEDKLISALVSKFNFKILNGDETLAEQQYYFTNANLIIGPHSSLMCNTIWCKNNPVFIELAPTLRCQQLSFFDDTVSLGIKSVLIPCMSDNSEQILLTDDNILNIVKIVNILI